MNVLLTHHVPDYVNLLLPVVDSVHVVDNGFRCTVPQKPRVFALRLPKGGFGRQLRFLRSYLASENISLIYVQGIRDMLLYRVAGCRLRTRPRFLLTSHSPYTWRSAWKLPVVLALARLLGDGFVFLASGPYRQWSPFCRQIGLLCWHVPNPVDVSRFSSKTERERSAELQAGTPRVLGAKARQASMPLREWRLGCVAVIQPRKGQHILLQAAAQLRKRGFQLRVELVGDVMDAAYKHKLDEMVAWAGLQSVVAFHGRMPYSEIPGFLAGLDVYVCPSLSEMMPFHVLEAMAAGLPVVGTKIWGVEDAVISGQNGFLCSPGSAEELAERLRELLQSPNLGGFRQASRQRAERCYDIPVVAEQYRRVLDELCAPLQARSQL